MTLEPRDLALAALSTSFDLGETLALADQNSVAQALEQYQASMVPIAKLPKAERDDLGHKLMDALKPIGAKLAPTMTPDGSLAWREAVADSLAKWPFRVALAAAKAGRHEPYPFGIGGVDAKLHELAAEHDARHRRAIHRLRLMAGEIERALNPPKVIEQQPHIWTQEQIDEANRTFRKIGIKTRYLLNGTDADAIQLTDEELAAEREGTAGFDRSENQE